MKKIFIALVVFMLVVGCVSCVGAGWLMRWGAGPVVTEERAISNFTRVDLTTFGNLYITQGEQESLRIEAEQNVLPYLETKVSGDTLELKEQPNVLIFHNRPVNFYLTVKNLDTITLSGSGDISMPALSGEKIKLNISGSGDIALHKLEANQLEVLIMGSGDVTISGGQVEQQQVVISGSGGYKAQNLASAEADAQVTGSGDIKLQVRNRLAVNINGSGDVHYAGNPIVQQHITGSGDVKPMTGM